MHRMDLFRTTRWMFYAAFGLILMVPSCSSEQAKEADAAPAQEQEQADQSLREQPLDDAGVGLDRSGLDQRTLDLDLRGLDLRPADAEPSKPDQSSLPERPLLCGERVCDPWREDCCLAESSEECVPRGTCTSDKINCLSAASCPSYQSCCFFVNNSPLDIACVNSCPALTLCETNADCGAGVDCLEMTASINICNY